MTPSREASAMDELKPCPHCGGPPERHPYQHDRSRYSYGCGASPACCNFTYTEGEDADARAAWNRRFGTAELAALRARCEDLEMIVREIHREEITRFKDGWRLLGNDGRAPIELDDDGTGLPLLTNEARRALKGEK